MKTLPLCIVLVTLSAAAQSGANANMIRDRGATRPADQTQTLDRGRLGHQDAMPAGPLTFTGMLVDAGCRDRSSRNLRQPSQPLAALTAPPMPGAAFTGITVDQKTLDAERSGIMEHQVPDMLSRQPDMACSITGDTRAFALLLDNGRLLDLDEGGNTFAGVALQASEPGRAMMAGFGRGLKPRVVIEGSVRGDRLIVGKLGSF
jgi:hypothetical protein